jgi:hypothetical protein
LLRKKGSGKEDDEEEEWRRRRRRRGRRFCHGTTTAFKVRLLDAAYPHCSQSKA